MLKRIVVSAGLIRRPGGHPARGPFLISQRMKGTHLADMWEFPGGKVEPGEAPSAALVRELREELGIECQVVEAYAVGHHVYESREVILLIYACELISGTPQRLEVADFRWIAGSELIELPLPPADVPVIDRLRRELAACARD